jgi:hypothetical protein
MNIIELMESGQFGAGLPSARERELCAESNEPADSLPTLTDRAVPCGPRDQPSHSSGSGWPVPGQAFPNSLF